MSKRAKSTDLVCPMCGSGAFETAYALATHILDTCPSTPGSASGYLCSKGCGQRFKTVLVLRAHTQADDCTRGRTKPDAREAAAAPERFSCDRCGQDQFLTIDSVKAHQTKKPNCAKMTDDEKAAARLTRVKYHGKMASSPVLTCPRCGVDGFFSDDSVQRHLAHSPNCASLSQEQRDMGKKKRLDNRRRTHGNGAAFECPTCHRFFAHKASLTRHIRTVCTTTTSSLAADEELSSSTNSGEDADYEADEHGISEELVDPDALADVDAPPAEQPPASQGPAAAPQAPPAEQAEQAEQQALTNAETDEFNALTEALVQAAHDAAAEESTLHAKQAEQRAALGDGPVTRDNRHEADLRRFVDELFLQEGALERLVRTVWSGDDVDTAVALVVPSVPCNLIEARFQLALDVARQRRELDTLLAHAPRTPAHAAAEAAHRAFVEAHAVDPYLVRVVRHIAEKRCAPAAAAQGPASRAPDS